MSWGYVVGPLLLLPLVGGLFLLPRPVEEGSELTGLAFDRASLTPLSCHGVPGLVDPGPLAVTERSTLAVSEP